MSAVEGDIFTGEWAGAWAEEINASEAYRGAAASWDEPMVLTMKADRGAGVPEDRSVYLDLYRGECREARAATEHDVQKARYVIRATPKVWEQAIDGSLKVSWALLRGELKVLKGSKSKLSSHAEAWRQMIAAARRVEDRPRREPAQHGRLGELQ